MGCSTTVVKYLVFFFNLLFAIAGLALLAVGVLMKLSNYGIETYVPDKYQLNLPPILLLVVGSIIFITAFFGCCGAIKESTCMLTTFAIILLTLLIIQVAIGVYAFMQKGENEDLRSSVAQAVRDGFNQYNTSKAARDEFDLLQLMLDCCGVDSPNDWNWLSGQLPNSCCDDQHANCTLSSPDRHNKGCAEVTYDWLLKGLGLLGGLVILVALFEIIGAVFALCLASSIRNQIRRGAYA